jgi:hypothetical protein
MIWSMDLDDFSNHCRTGKYPLVNSIVKELEGYKVKLEYRGPHEGTAGAGTKGAKKDRKRKVFKIQNDPYLVTVSKIRV